ncbi:MAG: LytR/AlgR family response regulator transcription factor [Lachnotalea sp.]
MRNLIIAICDDEPIIITVLKEMLTTCLLKMGIDGEIETFESGEALLEQVVQFDAVFLDIEMPGLNGIETAKCIKEMNISCKIIFSTSKDDYFKVGFIVDIFRYVTKPFASEELEEVLEALQSLEGIEGADLGMEVIELFVNRSQLNVKQKSIQYILSYDSYSEFKLKNITMRRDISLNELENILDERIFYRIHRKQIVNMMFIDDYDSGVITMGDEQLIVSRRKKKNFERVYMIFDTTYR